MNKLVLAKKTISQLGLRYSLLYGIYRFGLWSGHYRRETPSSFFLPIPDLTPTNVNWPIPLQNKDTLQKILLFEKKDLLNEADEILNGRFRFFGGSSESFTFKKHRDLLHWSAYELGKAAIETEDIKLIWEPARFGWAFILARAYFISNDENYAQCFWRLFDEFTSVNPFNSGPNWSSAQEVALRLIALIFAGSVFRKSKSATSQRMLLLLASIYMHTKRIPPTLVYARAQNNNHLISEAVGLYCAGSFFNSLPIAKKWKALGWKWFNHAIQEQIGENGEFIQHSLNYHRLMLQASLWMDCITRANEENLPVFTLGKLCKATEWLLNYIEPTSGHVPNLGHNDGSNIFPLSQCAYADYRPVAQAASRAFLKKSLLPSDIWDESCYWLNLPISTSQVMTFKTTHTNGVPWLGDSVSRVYLQAVKYRNRPAHADQLHVDFWYKGYNLAMDAGTYSYNAFPPWENAMAQTLVHNSITIDGTSQMKRAGKFLWLDWAQARLLRFEPAGKILKAEHDGYKKLGINHEREIKFDQVSKWNVLDTLNATTSNPKEHLACLHWLLPDWSWKLDGNILILKAPFGEVILTISGNGKIRSEIDLIRCGKSLLLKQTASPNLGWYSPTYNFKEPAISLTYCVVFTPPVQFTTQWQILEKQG